MLISEFLLISNCKILIIFSELWRKETQLTQTLSANKEELGKADQALRSMAGRVSREMGHQLSLS